MQLYAMNKHNVELCVVAALRIWHRATTLGLNAAALLGVGILDGMTSLIANNYVNKIL